MKRGFILFIAILAFGLITGCNQEEETVTETVTEITTTEATTEVVTTEEVVLKTIGTEDENAYAVLLKNSTGKNIISVSVLNSEANEYSDELLAENDIFEKDESRILYCEKVEGQSGTDAEDKLLPIQYDVKIVLDDETEYVLHAIPVEYEKEITIFVEDEVAYVEYDKTSTKESELYLLEEERSKQKSSSQKTTSSNSGSNSGSNSTSNSNVSPASTPASTPETAPTPEPTPTPAPDSQDSESCIGDEGLLY